ncbi:MAG: entericidin A/B family lipoprotein [Burkholderiaceae bacterium]|jgi:entericidin B|nr:entericidin A/B family lipoprotein [Burkholderiaceae bacterium]
MKRLFVVIVAVLVGGFAIAGCNTIAGMGKDIEAAGGAVDKAATDTKKKM